MARITEEQYKIIAERMVEEHRKYGDSLRPGHWADVAARKVVSHIEDFIGYERVFTESEVKAMASEIVEAAMAECNTVYHTDEDAEAEMSAMIRRILERHGVVLDPA